MKLLFVFLISLFSALFLTPLLRRVAVRFKLLDQPDPRKIHTRPVPVLGGAAVFVGLMLALAFTNTFSRDINGIILGGMLILVVGVIDDIRTLPALVRLGLQILAALIVIKSGVVLTFLPNNLLGYIGEWTLTILWVVGITNALNFLDGMDGLATGLGIISGLGFFIVAYQTNQPLIMALSLALVGSSLGFLPYNLKPQNIFLGDSGSTFIGFILASMAIMGNWAEDNVIALSLPILVLGVPIFDLIFTTVMRVANGEVRNVIQWMEYVGRDHFHHRLVGLGLRPFGAVSFIWFVSICLGLSAVVLWKAQTIDALLLLVQASIIFTIIAVLMIVGKRRQSGWER